MTEIYVTTPQSVVADITVTAPIGGSGGGDTPILNKSVRYTNNGNFAVEAESGTAMKLVNVAVDVPQPILSPLSESFTDNGKYTFAPNVNEGYSRVDIDINVPSPRLTELSKTITKNGDYQYTGAFDEVNLHVDVEGDVTLPTKNKDITITDNGSYTVNADDGTVMEKVDIEVNIPQPKIEGKRTERYTNNGTYQITPQDGFNAIDSVEVEVDVPQTILIEREETIEENGEYEYIPNSGSAYSKVKVKVEVPSTGGELQTKEVVLTTNGEHTITPDDGFDGMSEVKVTNSVYEGFDLGEIGVEGVLANTVNSGIRQALVKNRELMEWGKTNTSWASKMKGVFFVDIPMTHVTSLNSAFYGNQHLLYMYDFNVPNCTDFRNMFSHSAPPSITQINAEKATTFQGSFQNANLVNCQGDISINVGNKSTTNSNVVFTNAFQNTTNINLNRFEIVGDRVSDLNALFFVAVGNINELVIESSENVTSVNNLIMNGVTVGKLILGSVERCTNFTNFTGNRNPSTVHFTRWKTTNIPLAQASKLLPESINYIIEHALGEEDGATQRTLTLHATAKANWQQDAEYEKYAAMAVEKLITIA